MAWFYAGGMMHSKDGKVRASYSSGDGLGLSNVTDLHLDRNGTLRAAAQGGPSRLKSGRAAKSTDKKSWFCL